MTGRTSGCGLRGDGSRVVTAGLWRTLSFRSMHLRPILLAVLALAAIWGAVAGVMALTEKHTSTPEKVQELMGAAPWYEDENLDEASRKTYLDEVIAHV